MKAQQTPELICKDKLDLKTKKHVLVCSMNVRRQAGKHISEPFKMLLKGTYIKERGKLHKALDLITMTILTATVIALVYLLIPKSTPDFVIINASVAPTPITTGDVSTLTFEYENNSDEIIKNAQLSITLPAHFELTLGELKYSLGDITPGSYGYIHIEGAMFGDVSVQQIFTTELSYTYSEQNIPDKKTKEHNFSPEKSALELNLELPKNIVAYQEVEGEIQYTNTGSMEFPNVVIEPVWPDGFVLIESSPSVQANKSFHITSINPGETGVINFKGRLGSQENSTFIFNPSFSFDDTSYKQTQLVDVVDIIPSPIQLSHSIYESAVAPGETITVNAIYENVSEFDLSNIIIKVKSDTDIFSTTDIVNGKYSNGYYIFENTTDTLSPGDKQSVSITIPVKSTLSRSATSEYENIYVNTVSYADFAFEFDGVQTQANTVGSSFKSPLTSPIVLNCFGRYWGPNGDQLGRGPVPPIADETTKYWIFCNISSTTNTLSNLTLEADLGQNVSLTGRQSVSIGSSIASENGSIIWRLDELSPTLLPTSAVVGIAFEVAITPSLDQAGLTPTLIGNSSITATDNFTNSFISSASDSVTTSLPYDTKAYQYGGVVTQ